MGKKNRQRDDRISVFDAAEVISMAETMASIADIPNLPPSSDLCGSSTKVMLARWRKFSPVALRIDSTFAQALAESDMNAELIPDWQDRLPFDTFVGSLSSPLVLYDGITINRYIGFIVGGIVVGPPRRDAKRFTQVDSSYRALAGADGFRFIWFFRTDEDPQAVQGQAFTWFMRGPHAKADVTTLAQLVEHKINASSAIVDANLGTTIYQSTGMDKPHGLELPTLIPLSVQLLLYLAATEPEDIQTIPPQKMKRPSQLADAKVIDMGWRTGAALRMATRQAGAGTARSRDGGWKLPPHMRRAHWARRRIATRNEAGVIIGDRQGLKDIDWHYELRWLAPTGVNIEAGDPVQPSVRSLK